MSDFYFLPLGILVGTIGTLIGAGGGFILVPLLMMMYPKFSAQEITAISMFCVACNGTSGSIAYFYRKQVHLKTALIFTLASVPGAWMGSSLTRAFDRKSFELFFAAVLFILGLVIFFRKPKSRDAASTHESWIPTGKDFLLGFAISLGVGFLAAALGIGGGIVHVPLLSQALAMPVHLAAGTSHFILAITAIVATVEHFMHGDFPAAATFLPHLALGIVAGAQLGAWLSKRVSSVIIMKSLAIAILLVGLRICWAHYPHAQLIDTNSVHSPSH